nr:MAG: hypothetical protein DIU78_06935 [Pseudomonadota bacterium]
MLRGPSRHVLVIDDDPGELARARKRLEKQGHRVTLRETALGLEPLLDALRPDVVLLKVLMPHLTGASLERLLRAYPATGTPAVILHSSLPQATLARVVDIRGALGVLRTTSDDVVFFFALAELLDRLPPPRTSLGPPEAEPEAPVLSGMRRIGSSDLSDPLDLRIRRCSRTTPGSR